MPKVIVAHRQYGCDSGCCGHIVMLDGERRGGFYFDHPYPFSEDDYDDAVRRFVKEIVTNACGEEHVKDIDWQNCLVLND